MTRLLVDPATDFDDPAAVTLNATLLDPDPSLVRTFTVATADDLVELPAPDSTEAWRLTIRRAGRILEERTVHFGDVPTVAWAALTDVDPTTLQTPPPGGEPAWQALLDELRAQVGGGAVASVNTHTGDVVLGATDVGADPAGAASTAQAFAIQRANHTGTQSADTLTDGTTGKAYTGTERTKLAGIAAAATANRTDAATDALLAAKADATALAAKADLVGGVVPTSQIPALALNTVVTVASRAAMLALTPAQVQPGDVAVDSSTGSTRGSYMLLTADPSAIGSWTLLNAPTDVVSSVNGQTGTVALGKTDIGLGNVDNTADTGKPVSVAQQAAIDAVTLAGAPTTLTTSGTAAIGVSTLLNAAAGPVTVTLPAPTRVGQLIHLERIDTTTNAVTVSGTIRGSATTLTFSATGVAGEAVVYRAESLTSWRPLTSHKPKALLDTLYTAVGTPATPDYATFNIEPTAEETVPRVLLSTICTVPAGRLSLAFFTAKTTGTRSQVRVYSGSTAAGATPTLARIGLYSVGATALTLVAATASDTTLFAAANTGYTRSFTATPTLTAGVRYALAVLVVTAATAPNFPGTGPSTASVMSLDSPLQAGWLASQTDLPASVTISALQGTNPFYGRLLA